jgi:hypothetical protein
MDVAFISSSLSHLRRRAYLSSQLLSVPGRKLIEKSGRFTTWIASLDTWPNLRQTFQLWFGKPPGINPG